MDYPISTVVEVLALTGRPVSRHWIQQEKKYKHIVPARPGRGRAGDRYTPETIMQVALFYDLSRKFTNEEAARITFNHRTQELLNRASARNVLSKDYHKGPVSLVFMEDHEGKVVADEIISFEDHHRLFDRIHFGSSRSSIVSLIGIVGQVESALRALGH